MNKTREIIKKYNIYFIFIVLVIVCALLSSNFFTPYNLANIGKQWACVTILSMGMLMVVMTGGIDLSVGSVVALGSVMIATAFSNYGFNMLISVAVTLAFGALCGLFSGFFVAQIRMPAFIVTMAMLTIAKGIAFIVSNGSPIKTEKGTLDILGKGSLGPVPYLVIISIIIVLIFAFVIRKTTFGRIVKAIGSNEDAVLLAGVRTNRYIIAVYVISGVCAALGGILSASRTGTGTPLYGDGLELDAIAACVIGGASLSGGKGSAINTLIGVLVLALIGNIMNLMAVPSYPQDVIQGLIIIAAIWLQIITSKKK